MSTSAAKIVAVPLGAGQEIGRSCVVVRMGGHSVMFDCGIHTAFTDERCFPRFDMLLPGGAAAAVAAAGGGGSGGGSSGGSASAAADAAPSAYAHVVDALVITHYHLDHVGALPHFVSVLGYRGPIFMTSATRGIAQTMLLDYVYVMRDRKQVEFIYTKEDLLYALSRVTVISLHERVRATSSLTLTPYYAGHVLGAVMVHAEAAGHSVVYTGDFNATADGHLGPAAIPPLRPHLLITESTYASSTRSSQKRREDKFLRLVISPYLPYLPYQARGQVRPARRRGGGGGRQGPRPRVRIWARARAAAAARHGVAGAAAERANLLRARRDAASQPPLPPLRLVVAPPRRRGRGAAAARPLPVRVQARASLWQQGHARRARRVRPVCDARHAVCGLRARGLQALGGRRGQPCAAALVLLPRHSGRAAAAGEEARDAAPGHARGGAAARSLPDRGPRCGSQRPRLPVSPRISRP